MSARISQLTTSMLFVLAAAACDDGSGEGDSGREADDTVGSPATHDETSTEGALISGILDGTPECVWLRIGGERHALVLPSGTSTQRTDDDISLVDQEGHELARTGDEVVVTGGYRRGERSCAAADATGPTIVAGAVRRSED